MIKPTYLFIAAGLLSPLQAAVVSINFGSNQTNGSLAPATAAGAYSAANWNNVSADGATLVDSTGASTSVTVNGASGFPGSWGNGKITANTGGEQLYKGYLDIQGTATSLVIGGLSATTIYQIYVYSNGENNSNGLAQSRTGTFTLGGVSTGITDGRTGEVESTFNGSYNLVPAGTTAEGNYTIFTVTGATSYTLTAQGTFAEPGRGDPYLRSPINGIQIVSVPEPTLGLLGGLAALVMLRVRRR